MVVEGAYPLLPPVALVLSVSGVKQWPREVFNPFLTCHAGFQPIMKKGMLGLAN